MGGIEHALSRMRNVGLTARFSLVSLLLLSFALLVLGAWLTLRIETAAVTRSTELSGTYIQVLMGPHLRKLERQGWQGAEAIAALDAHFHDEAVLDSVPAVKVWLGDGTIVYSSTPQLIGSRFPVDDTLRRAFAGDVQSSISELEAAENRFERDIADRLMEVYVPIRRERGGEVYAVGEFYLSLAPLEATAQTARLQTWGVVIGLGGLVYLLLFGMVRETSRTMRRQRDKLARYSMRLRALLRQNRRMHRRVVQAGANAMAINEHYLQRLSADLHDGAGQDLALVLLRLDEIQEQCTSRQRVRGGCGLFLSEELAAMRVAAQSALQDVRSLSKELRLSAVDTASVVQTVQRAVRDYARKTGRKVSIVQHGDDVDAPQSVKITLYRVAQEALMNGFQHAREAEQEVDISVGDDQVTLKITDTGPGFRVGEALVSGRLGLVGMRDRVQLLGGAFSCVSCERQGTRVTATLPRLLPGGK
ncbi:hypothetical protein DU490_12945 [Halomonas sp. DQ26W]|uniref:sensor histidine kinase n=1 Tax=Halomonas sp. DQ26W TaxID=2282311 RepID=UPI000DF79033|nr:ATP-binding protein [Halomonas sp. DQ26W]RDB42439.1 hypothetical protein DU490_12945 [Halomonas sp. DQ26W]